MENIRPLRVLRNRHEQDHFYIVAVGDRPGVYYDFELECNPAIGDRRAVPTPQWIKCSLNPNADDIEKFRRFMRRNQLPAQVLERIPNRARRAYEIEQLNQLRAGQAAQNGQIQDLAVRVGRMEGVLAHVGGNQAYLERSYEEAMTTVADKVRGGPVGANNALMQQQYNLTLENLEDQEFCVAYTHGAYFKAGPEAYNAHAGIGVWFGENSLLNIDMRHIPQLRCSKNDAELFAVLCALHIAKIKRLQLFAVKTSSKFVVERINNRPSGASVYLTRKLLDALAELAPPNQRRVIASAKREKGSKEALNLALRSLRP